MANFPRMAMLHDLTPGMAAEVIRIRGNNRISPEWGLGQVVVAFLAAGRRIVVVGDTIYTLDLYVNAHDFLLQFQKDALGIEWGQQELAKPYLDRHPILQWHEDNANHWKRQREGLPPDLPIGIEPTGPMKALYTCAFDLFTVANNRLLDSKLLRRLRIKDQFHGARYELFVRAFLLRARFSLTLENEDKRGSQHFEFTATSLRSKQSFSVEAKGRHRPGHLGHSGIRQSYGSIRLDFGFLMSGALAKPVRNSRIVFIDLNFPPTDQEEVVPVWFKQMSRIVRRKEHQKLRGGGSLPPCYLVLTNHPYHYGEAAASAPKGRVIVTGFNIPGYRALGLQGQLAHHPVVGELVHGAQLHDIPHRFPV
jgi:hypothetical protein